MLDNFDFITCIGHKMVEKIAQNDTLHVTSNIYPTKCPVNINFCTEVCIYILQIVFVLFTLFNLLW